MGSVLFAVLPDSLLCMRDYFFSEVHTSPPTHPPHTHTASRGRSCRERERPDHHALQGAGVASAGIFKGRQQEDLVAAGTSTITKYVRGRGAELGLHSARACGLGPRGGTSMGRPGYST